MFAWLQPRSQIRVWLIGCSQIIGRDFDGLAPAKFIIQTFMGFPEKTSQFQFSTWLQPSPLLKKYKIWKIIENINHSLAASSKVQVFVWNLETTSWKPVYSRWQSGCKQHNGIFGDWYLQKLSNYDVFSGYRVKVWGGQNVLPWWLIFRWFWKVLISWHFPKLSILRHLDNDLMSILKAGEDFSWERINFVLEARSCGGVDVKCHCGIRISKSP